MAKLYFYYAAMNAGKSTILLQSNHNYIERGMSTLLFTPKFDDRHVSGMIHSRIGLSAQAIPFEVKDDLAVKVRAHQQANLGCVLVDEAQFLTKLQVTQLARLTDTLNVPVLAYGLRTDFRGELFEGSQYLLAWAEELVEIKTICHCGSKATMNMRVDALGQVVKHGRQVQIGGNESYVSTCRHHFHAGQSHGLQQSAAQLIEIET